MLRNYVVDIKAVKTKISAKLLNIGQTTETDKMPKSVSYHSYLIESLKDPSEASAYFKAVLEEKDVELLQKAINNLIEAGYNNLAIGLNLESLNNPTLLSTIATKVESQNLFQTAEIELKQRV